MPVTSVCHFGLNILRRAREQICAELTSSGECQPLHHYRFFLCHLFLPLLLYVFTCSALTEPKTPAVKILLHLCPKWICFIMAYTRIITIFLQRFKASSLLCQGVPLTDFFLLSWWTPHRSSFCAVSSIVQKWCHRLVPAHVGGFIQATFISSNYLHLSAEQSLSFSSFSHCCW